MHLLIFLLFFFSSVTIVDLKDVKIKIHEGQRDGLCSTLYDWIPEDEKTGQQHHTSALTTPRITDYLPATFSRLLHRASLIPPRCTSPLFQQSKFCHRLRAGHGPPVMCAYRPLRLSLGQLTSYSGGILNGLGAGRSCSLAEAENTHTNLHHLLCDSVEIPPTQLLSQKYTHQRPPLPPAQASRSADTPFRPAIV